MNSSLLAIAIAISASFGAQPSPQQYSQYIDGQTGVVKRPEGEGWTDPYGDGVWRSSWFYASLLVIRAKDPGSTTDSEPSTGYPRTRLGCS